jgi:hypothetical protein
MNLSVLDRLLLLNILPQEGDITSIRIIRKLREDLSFSEQEHKDFAIEHTEGQVKWDAKTAVDKDVVLGPKAQVFVADVLKKLSTDKKLTEQHLALYEKFVTPEGD